MSNSPTLIVEPREHAGSSKARAVRRSGLIPGNIYGGKKESEMISIDPKTLIKEYSQSGFFSRVFNLSIGGKTQQAIAKAIQLHPVTDKILHVEFQRVSKDSNIHVAVPIHFINEDKSPGIKKGGMLNIVSHSLELICPVHSIPESFVIDLDGLEIGKTIHLEDITLPKGSVAAHPERDKTIATIVPPAAAEEEKKPAS